MNFLGMTAFSPLLVRLWPVRFEAGIGLGAHLGRGAERKKQKNTMVIGLRRVASRCRQRIPRRRTDKRGCSRARQEFPTHPSHAATRRATRRLGRLDRLGRRRRHCQTRQQQPSRQAQTRLTMPAAQQPVVPDLHESLRQHVQDEPTQELLCRQRQQFFFALIRVVPIT